MCFGHLKEPSHQDCSFEYPQHMFWLRNKKNHFQVHTLIWGPACNEVSGHFMVWPSVCPELAFSLRTQFLAMDPKHSTLK